MNNENQEPKKLEAGDKVIINQTGKVTKIKYVSESGIYQVTSYKHCWYAREDFTPVLN